MTQSIWNSRYCLTSHDSGRFYYGSLVIDRWSWMEHYRKPGCWSIAWTTGPEILKFMDTQWFVAQAIVDDYGNLVRIN